jgi:hypothetical protein
VRGVTRYGVEASDAFVADDAPTAQAVELDDCLERGLNGGESLEKASVGALANLIEAPGNWSRPWPCASTAVNLGPGAGS